MHDKVVLLIDDNPDDVELALHAFRSSNMANRIVVRDDGQAAIDYLLDSGQPLPAVILLDLNLPKLSGTEVLRAIRSHERTRLLPVVVMTTSREEKDILNSYLLNANSYIVKPVDFNQFAEAVRQLGMYWLLLNQAPPLKDDSHA